jgi:hypothetical protein
MTGASILGDGNGAIGGGSNRDWPGGIICAEAALPNASAAAIVMMIDACFMAVILLMVTEDMS